MADSGTKPARAGGHYAPLMPSGRQAVTYMLLPQILPRIRDLFFAPFRFLPYLLALVFYLVRLLPPAHPYLDGENVGRFGIRHVVAAAAQNVKLDKNHIDQVVIFGMVLTGVIILAMYGISLLVFVVITPVLAATAPFNTPFPEHDIALNMMDRVFGVPGVFNSGYANGGNFPNAFHQAFHGLLSFYSSVIFIMALLIVLYYVVVVIYETNATGTPFGKRFDSFFTPLRLIAGLGLLIPIAYGVNTAQFMALYAAKWGSGLATNGWIQFNAVLANPGPWSAGQGYVPDKTYIDINGNPYTVKGYTYPTKGYIAQPNVPSIKDMVAFMHLARTCMVAYQEVYNLTGAPSAGSQPRMAPYVVARFKPGLMMSDPNTGSVITTFQQALEYNGGEDITIRIGQKDKEKWPAETGGVYPFCGEYRIPVQNTHAADMSKIAGIYYDAFAQMLTSGTVPGDGTKLFATALIEHHIANNNTGEAFGSGTIKPCTTDAPYAIGGTTYPLLGMCKDRQLAGDYSVYAVDERQAYVDKLILEFITKELEANVTYKMKPEMLQMGWAGAGVWYNQIAEYNGLAISMVNAKPSVTMYPSLMEKVFDQKSEMGQLGDLKDLFSVGTSSNPIFSDTKKNEPLLKVMDQAYSYWYEAEGSADMRVAAKGADKLTQMIAAVFGVEPILQMRNNTSAHPVAQMAAVGRGLIEKALINLSIGFGASFASGATSKIINADGQAAMSKGFKAFAGLFVTIASIGLSAGFMLYYLIPFFPFIYFFFAVGNWVKSVFEALVGVPLWALAHLHIEGKGFIPEAAQTGYLLLLEIFLRPIMIIFGLMAAVTIFGAAASVLNDIWDLGIGNLTGFAEQDLKNGIGLENFKNALDQMFFTVMYAVILYMMGLSSFKLIDMIPNNMIRFIGSGANSFSDKLEQPAEGMLFYLNMAVNQGFQKAAEGVTTSGEGLGRLFAPEPQKPDAPDAPPTPQPPPTTAPPQAAPAPQPPAAPVAPAPSTGSGGTGPGISGTQGGTGSGVVGGAGSGVTGGTGGGVTGGGTGGTGGTGAGPGGTPRGTPRGGTR